MKNEFQRPLAFNCALGTTKLPSDLFEYVPVPAGQSREEFCAALLENQWEPTQFVLAPGLAGDAEAAKILDHLKFVFETATFDCLCCETRCGAQHHLEKVGPLMTALAQHPAFVNSALVAWHASDVTAARATHAWQDSIYQHVTLAHSDLEQGLFYQRYDVKTAANGRRQLVIELDCHPLEQIETPQNLGTAYRCCRVQPHGIENIEITLGNVRWPVYIATHALDDLERELGRAFNGQDKASTLFQLACQTLATGWPWGDPMGDQDPFREPMHVEITLGNIPCGFFLGATIDNNLVITNYIPYHFNDEPCGDEPPGNEKPVVVLAELLRASGPLRTPDVPSLSDHAVKNLVALATELRRGHSPAYEIAALRELLAGWRGAQQAGKGERLLTVPFAAALERRNRRMGIRAANASPLELAEVVRQLVCMSESAFKRPSWPCAPDVDTET